MLCCAAEEVENLSSKLTDAQVTLEPKNRLAIINSSNSIGTRIAKLYDLIENDLYAKVQSQPTQISMYKHVKRA